MTSGGSNGSVTAVGDDDEASQATTLGDSCLWATAAQSCMAPRSCYNCLNVDVTDDTVHARNERPCSPYSLA